MVVAVVVICIFKNRSGVLFLTRQDFSRKRQEK